MRTFTHTSTSTICHRPESESKDFSKLGKFGFTLRHSSQCLITEISARASAHSLETGNPKR
jgi:hypothetical protein